MRTSLVSAAGLVSLAVLIVSGCLTRRARHRAGSKVGFDRDLADLRSRFPLSGDA
jgi:hypothetical protein